MAPSDSDPPTTFAIPRVSAGAITSLQESLRTEKAISEDMASEISQLLDDIAHDVADYSTDISRLERQILSLRMKHDVLKCAEKWARSILAPVRRLPNEILHEIFTYCGSGGNIIYCTTLTSDVMRQPAWAVSSTCAKWRHIALSCKPLWSNICLDFPPSTPVSTPRVPLCTPSHAISRCLHMSRQHPLTLEIRDWDITFLGTIGLLLTHASRWKDVYLGRNVVVSNMPLFSGYHFPTLETMSISQDPLHLHYFQNAPSLRRVTLNGSLPNGSLPSRLLSFPWAQITHLDLKQFHGPVFTALSACTNLEELKILAEHSFEQAPPSAAPTPFIELPKLRKLCIVAQGNAFDAAYNILNLIFAILTLPSLNSMELSSGGTRFYGLWPQSLLVAFVQRSRCSITTLKLDAMSLSRSEVQGLFSALPSIRELMIEDSRMMFRDTGRLTLTSELVTCLSAFTARDPFENERATLLPNLQQLVLRSRCRPSHSDSMYPQTVDKLDDTVLVNMIKSRWIPEPEYASLLKVRCLQSVSVTYLAAGRVMDSSAQGTLECLRHDGLKFRWMSEVDVEVDVEQADSDEEDMI